MNSVLLVTFVLTALWALTTAGEAGTEQDVAAVRRALQNTLDQYKHALDRIDDVENKLDETEQEKKDLADVKEDTEKEINDAVAESDRKDVEKKETEKRVESELEETAKIVEKKNENTKTAEQEKAKMEKITKKENNVAKKETVDDAKLKESAMKQALHKVQQLKKKTLHTKEVGDKRAAAERLQTLGGEELVKRVEQVQEHVQELEQYLANQRSAEDKAEVVDKKGFFKCRKLGEGCHGVPKCCGTMQCFWPRGYSLIKAGTCVTCVSAGLKCQRDAQCCGAKSKKLQCDKKTRWTLDGTCRPVRAQGAHCWNDSQCYGKCLGGAWIFRGGKCQGRPR